MITNSPDVPTEKLCGNPAEYESDNMQLIGTLLKPMVQDYFPELFSLNEEVNEQDSERFVYETSEPKSHLRDCISFLNPFEEPICPCEAESGPGSGMNPYSSPTPLLDLYNEPFDVYTVRKDFPILNEKINGKNLIWFDNAATTQKPKAVIERLKYYYEHENSNVHRAAHTLAARTTEAYEGARKKAARFLNAGSPDEIVFVRGCTEGINLVAQSYGQQNLAKGDEVLITLLEHHANIVPWQMVCASKGAVLKAIPVDDDGQVIISEYEKLLNAKTKIVAVTHVSNALGTITPLAEMIEMAHRYGAKVVVDGAQAVAHLKVDVQQLDCDFYAFSGHKLFGPTGIGVLYGKSALLEAMQPYQGGGNMISDVTLENTSYKPAPHKFEAGTGNIADAIGLEAAIDYVSKIGLERICQYEHQLLEYATEAMHELPGLSIIGNAVEKASILSFTMKGMNADEIGKALDEEGIAVRSGHHCSQPILRRFGLENTVRASLAFYNTQCEIDDFIAALWKIANRGYLL